ncbi:class I SAM-dependent methyltransferase [Gracilimonas mengyeensis]|uniref:Methyltransferase domain-containing protein n=1 Tax=Gracilimonas mengyeensis TaxID=1302730 RepID=A0A521FM23_9BACT|nr:class I SAM-dependent methyltransferase [Gracilimonas mengyeensis]SMO97176.1 hypothetical protein SAMN06265219_12321 [Gracilimonas mengyeensis]
MVDLTFHLSNPPVIHGNGTQTVHHINEETILTLNNLLKEGAKTVETGIGFSTLVFNLNRCNHICIAPVANEITLLKDYFKTHNIDYEGTTFINEGSEFALPKIVEKKVDVALIDGRHSFPTPFVDYYYLSLMLEKNGWLIVDDINLWTGKVMYDFLKNDPHWKLRKNIQNRTAFFTKEKEVDQKEWWAEQPYLVKKSKYTILKSRLGQLKYLLKKGNFNKLVTKVTGFIKA